MFGVLGKETDVDAYLTIIGGILTYTSIVLGLAYRI
jgi:hypothetical protein